MKDEKSGAYADGVANEERLREAGRFSPQFWVIDMLHEFLVQIGEWRTHFGDRESVEAVDDEVALCIDNAAYELCDCCCDIALEHSSWFIQYRVAQCLGLLSAQASARGDFRCLLQCLDMILPRLRLLVGTQRDALSLEDSPHGKELSAESIVRH